MKTTIFYSAWTSYLASRLPCPIPSYTFSKDHVAPKSLFPKVVVDDPRNIVPMPTKLNNVRGNRPFTADWQDGYMVYSCKSCPCVGPCRGAAVLSTSGLLPPDTYKGPVARSVLHLVGKYPQYSDKVNEQVLNLDTAIEWDSKFPMSKAEQQWIASLD